MDESRIREQITDSLKEWAFGNSPESTDLKTKVINAAVEQSYYRKNNPIDFDSLKEEIFPKNLHDSYEHLLRHEIVPSPMYSCRDKLKMSGYAPLYKRGYQYYKKRNFAVYSDKQLDPLCRFDYRETSEEQELFERWIVCENEDAMLGSLFEAAVACHILQHIPCHNCGCIHTLRWNGGAKGAWKDLVCINCKAMFELKTKANMEKVEKCFKWNDTRGGSFGSFCSLQNSKGPDQKMFLLLVPRQAENGIHPVTIAEIDGVAPQARDRTFNRESQKVYIGASIHVHVHTKANWFNLPELRTGEIPMHDMAKKVFIERFSKDVFDSFNDARKRTSRVKDTSLTRMLSLNPLPRMNYYNQPFLDSYGQYEMDTNQFQLNKENLFRFFEKYYDFCCPVSNHPQFRQLFGTSNTTTYLERTVQKDVSKRDDIFEELLRVEDYPAYLTFSS